MRYERCRILFGDENFDKLQNKLANRLKKHFVDEKRDIFEEYSEKILAIDVNLEIDQMLDQTWHLFQTYMSKDEVGIKQEFVDIHWKN